MDSARIMIVEDSREVAGECRQVLEDLHYAVDSVVTSGEDAVEKAGEERPDAVIMNIRLQGDMDASEAAAQIYSRYKIPVMFISAESDRSLLSQAREVGSFGYLILPFNERDMSATVEMTLYRAKVEKERRRMDTRVRYAHKMEGMHVMAGSIAHNFNNILQSTTGFMELAMNETEPGTELSDLVQKAYESATRAADLSKLMLVYVGQAQESIKAINLSELIENVSSLLRSNIRGRVSLSMDLAHEKAAIMADSGQLYQLIMNLFTNAVDAIGEEKGSISISTRVEWFETEELNGTYLGENLPAGDYVVLEVGDTGCGINGEALGNVFDPFFTTKFAGRGLGLAAVLGIVQGHRGAIDIKSESGKGTTLRVMFPVTDKQEIPVAKSSAASGARREDGSILLVDDEDTVLKVGMKMLERSGYKAMSAAGGREAVEIFRQHADEIDCVLLDLTMRHMDGEHAFREMRKIRPDIKVIFCSGYNENMISQRFADSGLAGFIQKPYTLATLKEKLAAVLQP